MNYYSKIWWYMKSSVANRGLPNPIIYISTTTSLAEVAVHVETVETKCFHHLIRLLTLTPQGYYP